MILIHYIIFFLLFLVLEISSSNVATSKPKDVDEIDNFEDMIELMASLGVSLKGCLTFDEMKLRVKQELTSLRVTIGKEVRIF